MQPGDPHDKDGNSARQKRKASPGSSDQRSKALKSDEAFFTSNHKDDIQNVKDVPLQSERSEQTEIKNEINAVNEEKITSSNTCDNAASSEISQLPALKEASNEDHRPATDKISKCNVEHNESVKPPHDEVETVSNGSKAAAKDTSNNAHCVDGSGDKAPGGTGAAGSDGQGLKAGPKMATRYTLGSRRIRYTDNIIHNGMFRGIYEGQIEASVKVIKLTKSEVKQATCSEANILKSISNQQDNVIYYLAQDIVQDNSGHFLLLAVEWCISDLATVLTIRNDFPMLTRETILDQLVRGLEFLHDSEIVHLNIKPINIFVKQCNQPKFHRIKIANFEYAKYTYRGRFAFIDEEKMPDMTEWTAPEIIDIISSPGAQKQCDNSCDIYSMGLVFFCVLSSERRFSESYNSWKAWMGNGFRDLILQRPDDISKGIVNLEPYQGLETLLVNKMLAKKPQERTSLNKISHDPVLWNSSKMLSYIDAIDSYLRQKNEASKNIVKLFEEVANLEFVMNGKKLWHLSLEKVIRNELFPKGGTDNARKEGGKRAAYNPSSARDLLRAIRNYDHHFSELPEHLKHFYGSHPDGYLNRWNFWFPNLLRVTYTFFKENSKDVKSAKINIFYP